MVYHINKIGSNLNPYRVDEAKESMDDEDKRQGKQGDDEQSSQQDQDAFGSSNEQNQLQNLLAHTHPKQKEIEIPVQDIDQVKLLHVDISSEPAHLKIRVFLFDGAEIPIAYVPVSRTLAVKLRSLQNKLIDVTKITPDPKLWLTVPSQGVKELDWDEDVTRITRDVKEKSLSRTIKMYVKKKTFLQKLGIQSAESNSFNNEIFAVYLTILILVVCFTLGIILIF